MSRTSRQIAVAWALCMLAFALRLLLIDAQPIWWDEAISVHLATSSLPQILSDRAAHVHPPLYFVLLKGWAALAGTTVFSVRFFSTWFNMLLIPAAYRFGHRWLGRRAALLGALFTAISSLNIIYSQEARAYAMLPLAYLALIAIERRITQSGQPVPRPTWVLLSLVEAAGIYLHYTFFFAAAFINLLIATRIWQERAERSRWLMSQALVVLLYLPWLLAVALNWGAVLEDVGAGDPFTEPAPIDYFVRLLWTFQMSGLTGASGYAPVLVSSLVVALLLAATLVAKANSSQSRSTTWYLLACWIVPLGGASLLWSAKPLSHPRYVAIFSIALLLLAAYLTARSSGQGWLRKWLAGFFGIAFAITNAISLQAYYLDPHFGKDDTVGVTAGIAEHATSGDLILVPPEDWSIPYYYQGQAQVEMIRTDDTASAWERLHGLTDEGMTAFVVGYNRANADRRGLVPFALESSGDLVASRDYGGLYLRSYVLERSVTEPAFIDISARLGPLQLTGIWIEQQAPADTAVTAALRWRLADPIDVRLRTALRLHDEAGIEWARTVDWLLDHRSLPTELWEAGSETVSYHVTPLRPGTPPLTYNLSIGLFWTENETVHPVDLLDGAGNPIGQSLPLGTVLLAPATGSGGDPYRTEQQIPHWQDPITFSDGLTLAGAAVDRNAAAPGQPLYATLHWYAESEIGVQITATVGIEQYGVPITTYSGPAGGRYPTELWRAGLPVIEHRRLIIPPTASSGTAAVFLQVHDLRIHLAQIRIDSEERLFAPPPIASPIEIRFGDVAELLGYNLERTGVSSAEPVVLTLYWRALEGASATEYTVFTHILADDGHVVGQHDAQPAGGGRPTTGWIPGEIIVDTHPMAFREEYSGTGRIEIGLYESTSLDRVLRENGEDQLILPTNLTIDSQVNGD